MKLLTYKAKPQVSKDPYWIGPHSQTWDEEDATEAAWDIALKQLRGMSKAACCVRKLPADQLSWVHLTGVSAQSAREARALSLSFSEYTLGTGAGDAAR